MALTLASSSSVLASAADVLASGYIGAQVTTQARTGAAGGKKRKSVFLRPQSVVVEVDGKLKRFSEEEFEEFLLDLELEAEEKAPKLIAKGRKVKPRHVEVKQAPPEIIAQVKEQAAETNIRIHELWARAREAAIEAEDEEILLLM